MNHVQSPPNWCRWCGCGNAADAAGCVSCGTELAPPAAGSLRIGQVVEIGRALFKKPAVAVAETGDGVTLVVKDEEPTPMALAEFDAMEKLELPGPAVRSDAGRLWRLVLASVNREQKGKWSVPYLDSIAWDIGRRTLAAARASILDRLRLGLDCDVSYLPVTESEMSWYRAYTAASTGNDRAMLDALLALPDGRYIARIELLLHRGAALLDAPDLHRDVVLAAQSLIGVSADARGICDAFSDASPAVAAELLAPFAERIAARASTSPEPLSQVAIALDRFERIPAISPTPMPYVQALDAYVAGRDGADLDSSLATIAHLPLECLDELVDRGAVRTLPAGALPWSGATASYVRCRVQPAAASEDELREAGCTGELARRAFLRADRAALEALADDADVLHYRALLDLQDRPGTAALPPGLRSDTVALVTRTRAVAAEAENSTALVPVDVLADSTLWPLLRKAAEQGSLRPEAPRHPLAEAFETWADLCVLQRKLFDGKWTEVVVGGSDLARRTAHEPFADEALNMAAYACMQLDQFDDARKLVDRALEGEFTIGLLVNAAVLAAGRGSSAAVPYLGRVADLAPTPDITAAAVGQAVQLWLDDARATSYPDELANLVRRTLETEISDEFFLDLIRLTSYNDGDWLATGNARLARTSKQTDMVRYFRARSRAFSDRASDEPKDFFAVLGDLLTHTPTAPWLDREREKSVAMLFDGVSVQFGEGWPTALCIEELLSRNVLTSFERLALAPQAGAHLAAFVGKDDASDLAPALEQRLILDTVAFYRRERGELNEGQDEFIRDNIVRCLACAAAFFMDAATVQNQRTADVYNELNARLRWDTQNTATILRRQRALLDDYDPYLARGEALTAAFNGFDLDESQRLLRNELANRMTTWRTENDKLRGRRR